MPAESWANGGDNITNEVEKTCLNTESNVWQIIRLIKIWSENYEDVAIVLVKILKDC